MYPIRLVLFSFYHNLLESRLFKWSMSRFCHGWQRLSALGGRSIMHTNGLREVWIWLSWLFLLLFAGVTNQLQTPETWNNFEEISDRWKWSHLNMCKLRLQGVTPGNPKLYHHHQKYGSVPGWADSVFILAHPNADSPYFDPQSINNSVGITHRNLKFFSS